jgi:hypothetical protein
MEATKFVFFEYDKSNGMCMSEAKEATQHNFLGSISASRKRAMYRNMSGVYAAHMEKEIVTEYNQLLVNLGFVPALSSLHKFRQFIGHFFGGRN